MVNMSNAIDDAAKRPRGRQRLDSLKNPLPRIPFQTANQSQLYPSAARLECPNADCTDKDVGEEDGQFVCRGCGTVVNDSNMVAEVVFGETSGGAHMIHGSHVAAGQTYAKSALGMKHRAMGGGGSREITEGIGW